MSMRSGFTHVAKAASRFTGRPLCFALAVGLVLVWLVSGPLFGFSDTWQLVINTGTTVITFLMVFLIQNTQNRDTEAMQIKLDELIRATRDAHNALLDLEELDEAALDRYRNRYQALAKSARAGGEIDEVEERVGPTPDLKLPLSVAAAQAAIVARARSLSSAMLGLQRWDHAHDVACAGRPVSKSRLTPLPQVRAGTRSGPVGVGSAADHPFGHIFPPAPVCHSEGVSP